MLGSVRQPHQPQATDPRQPQGSSAPVLALRIDLELVSFWKKTAMWKHHPPTSQSLSGMNEQVVGGPAVPPPPPNSGLFTPFKTTLLVFSLMITAVWKTWGSSKSKVKIPSHSTENSSEQLLLTYGEQPVGTFQVPRRYFCYPQSTNGESKARVWM